MRKCLIISYHFAPGAQVGAIRPAKFARYLPVHGWEAHVLTVAEKYHPLQTDWCAEDLPDGGRLHRTRMWVHPNDLYLKLKRLFSRGDSALEGQPAPTADGTGKRLRKGSPVRDFVNSLLRLPDDKLPWIPVALPRALRLVRRHSVDAVVTTGPPHSTHLIGLALKRLAGATWFADLRDPWLGNVTKSLFPSTRLSAGMDRRMERAVVRGADRVIVTNEFVRKELLESYPDLAPHRIVVITNGFDKLDFDASSGEERPEEFTLVHTGNLYNLRSPRALLQAIADLVESGRVPASRLRVQFVGRMIADAHPLHIARDLGLERIVTASEPVPHHEAVTATQRADLLLVLAQGEPNQIPAKVFEYIATGNRLLVVPDDGAAAELVRERDLGWTAADDPARIAEAIAECYERSLRGGRERMCEQPWLDPAVRAFDREVLAGELAAVMDEALAGPNPSAGA
ncbi:MAG: glycosyltransferase [Planctomycetota bacterium]|jgi:glycosyltransferase involved in cell wall biosynthesis|nr:glycosyltransferase [Planctomycetota bacterium]MDP6989131.1 glycosyltransferase [Planctomycetota bacterium]